MISGKNRFDHFTTDICQAHVATHESIGEFFMIKAKQVQYRRMKVGNGNFILNRVITKLVGCAVDRASADTTSSEPHGEPAGMIVPAFATLGGRGAPKLPSPDHKCAFKQATVF